MKRLGKLVLLLVLALSLLVSVVAVTASAGPIHIGGDRASFTIQFIPDPGNGFTPLSVPIHIGGD